jgi:CheY-like chemotaxis protein
MIRILIAGRDRLTRSAFKTALDKRDTQTACLESGREALSAVSESMFDLLAADEHLGDISLSG